MSFLIRAMAPDEYGLLEDLLYEAIFVPEGVAAPPRSILQQPELEVYIAGFGQAKDDHALVAIVDQRVAGAIWARIMDDYGHIDDATPSLAMALYPQYRGQGIGTALLLAMLDHLKHAGYAQVSLSVQKDNYALKMYQKAGFVVFDEADSEYRMLCPLA